MATQKKRTKAEINQELKAATSGLKAFGDLPPDIQYAK